MSYSTLNPSWGRLQQSRADAEREDVVALARALLEAKPGWSWGEALRWAELGALKPASQADALPGNPLEEP